MTADWTVYGTPGKPPLLTSSIPRGSGTATRSEFSLTHQIRCGLGHLLPALELPRNLIKALLNSAGFSSCGTPALLNDEQLRTAISLLNRCPIASCVSPSSLPQTINVECLIAPSAIQHVFAAPYRINKSLDSVLVARSHPACQKPFNSNITAKRLRIIEDQ